MSRTDSLVRSPYRLSFQLWSSKTCRLYVIGLDDEPSAFQSHWQDGLTPDLMAFIANHCKCASCGARVDLTSQTCSCGRVKRGYLRVIQYDRNAHGALFNAIFDRETNRAKHRLRRARIEANGGTIKRHELEEVLAAQHHLCYYCAAPLLTESGKARWHADHFEPLAWGGVNDWSNIVLACPPCNLKKRTSGGDEFDRKARVRMSPEAVPLLDVIRKGLRAWRAGKRRAAGLNKSFMETASPKKGT